MRDLFTAVANLWQSIAPGGTLLIATPTISRSTPRPPSTIVHLAPAGLAEVIEGPARRRRDLDGTRQPAVAIAFLHGIAEEDLRPAELDFEHPLFPIVVTAAVRKPG